MSKSKTITADPPEVSQLFDAIADQYSTASGFSGAVVRCVAARYAGKNDFYSGAGAAKSGGRWNRKCIEAVYASLDIETANKEAFQDLIYRGIPLSAMMPRVTAAAQVNLSRVCDLTQGSVRRSIGFTRQQLISEDWRALQKAGVESWTQAIGRGCYLAGFEAMIVPSARRKQGKNIVLFPSKFAKTVKIMILGAEHLPK
ncbi:MAG: RES family NAD+ phosphorylase [Pirellulales bacterium]